MPGSDVVFYSQRFKSAPTRGRTDVLFLSLPFDINNHIFCHCPLISTITNSERQPVLNLIAQSEIPEVTIKSVPPRRSKP